MAEKPSIFVVDDDEQIREFLRKTLSRRGYPVATAGDGKEATNLLREQNFQIVLLDLVLPKLDGTEVLKIIKKEYPNIEVIVISGHGTMRTALDSLKMGAYDYIRKPFEISDLLSTVERVAEHLELSSRYEMVQNRLSSLWDMPGMIAESPKMQPVLEFIQKVAPAGSNILIQGETGSGKEVVANQVHKKSARSAHPFIAVNCSNLPDTLMESELFGHEPGAFTDASSLKHGLLEVADKGTLFLDEIGDIGPYLQAKLLRVVETGKFRRLGGTEEIEVNTRIISATNKNLAKEIAAQHFREDLFYRLSVVNITVPPLRERKEDIPLLVEYFLQNINIPGKGRKRISPGALEKLENYNWPGNIRELRNVIEQMIILTEREIIEIEDLPSYIRGGEEIEPLQGLLTEKKAPTLLGLEKDYIEKVLKESQGNREQAAKILGISPRALYYKIKRYGIK